MYLALDRKPFLIMENAVHIFAAANSNLYKPTFREAVRSNALQRV